MKQLILRYLIPAVLCFGAGCHSVPPPRPEAVRGPTPDHIVLPYPAFGPDVMAFGLIGHDWNQWKDEGHDLPDDVGVQVVVYRGVSPEQIRERYPVIRGRSDYRHVEYREAVRYLDRRIADAKELGEEDGGGQEMWADISARLSDTRRRIIEALGE